MSKTIKRKITKTAKGKAVAIAPTSQKRILTHQHYTLDSMGDCVSPMLKAGQPVRVLYCTRTGMIGVYEGVILAAGDEIDTSTHIAFELTKGDNKGEIRTLRYDRCICVQTGSISVHATI